VRLRYVAAALLTVAVGLGVHLGGSFLPPAVRDVIGDALWAAMMFLWISALWPSAHVAARASVALGISWTVELSQLYHTPSLDAARSTTLGRLILGSGFDVRDLVAYAGGVMVAVAIEAMVRRRARTL
jgi:hypothetical protein